MIVKGKLIKCKREVKKFKKGTSKNKLWITLAEVKLSDDQLKELREAFKDSGKNFTPDWILDPEGYVNVSTEFELPVRVAYTEEVTDHDSIESILKDIKWVGAECNLNVNIKEGAVYPVAIMLTKEGEARNPFAAFDEE